MDYISDANAKNIRRQSGPWFIVQPVKESEIFFGYQTENEFLVKLNFPFLRKMNAVVSA